MIPPPPLHSDVIAEVTEEEEEAGEANNVDADDDFDLETTV